ncbi:MAG: TIGR03118 family protein [Alphaproteobacteria bacterium]|nr:TIGR03118 family protein [Alphaproteobacteria bacterium]
MILRFLPLAMLCLAGAAVAGSPEKPANAYVEHRLVANKETYNSGRIDERLVNAWGIAIRPKGAGGHFWVTGRDQSFEYIGDVQNSRDEKLRKLHVDKLSHVTLPVGGEDKFATGVVFNGSGSSFVITQKPEGGEAITAPAKFLFASDGGIISAWTERKKADGSFDWPRDAIPVIDQSKEGAQFFGLAINAAYTRLYAADFGTNPGIKVFGSDFKRMDLAFDQPFDENKNGKVDAGEYAPFNIQVLQTSTGEPHLFVTYAKTQPCPEEEVRKRRCDSGELFAGEEDTSKPGHGRLAEFTEDGKLVAVWNDGGKLSAPWGLAFAPAGFGALSGKLLVSNFGDGTIAAFDPKSRDFLDVMRNKKGKPIEIPKIWGLIFGNGESLGDANALYFASGPDDEKDGIFGSLRAVPGK